AIFVRKETDYISAVNDLEGKFVAVQAGDIGYEIAHNIPNVKLVVKQRDQYQGMEALLNGEAEAFVGNRLTGLYYLQKIGKLNQIKIVGGFLYPTEYSSAVLKGNSEVLSLLNQGIDSIKATGTYDKIYSKWFGETFSDTSGYWKKLLFIAILGLVLTVALVIISMSWNKSLKKEVERRTKELASINQELQDRQVKLEQSNRLRGEILQSTPEGIIAFNEDGKVLAVNSAAKALLGIDIPPGSNWGDFELETVFDSESLNQALAGALWRKDLEWIKNQYENLYLDCSASPIKGPGEVVEGVILVMHDYTEEKKLKDVLYHQDKMQAIGRLTAGIAHELRNPLTAIKAFIDMLPYKYDYPKFRETITETVPQEIQRLNNLVSVLLDYSSPKVRTPQRVNLTRLIPEVLLLFHAHLEKKNIQMFSDVPSIEFWADEQQVKQVLINILLNGIEAGGGEISITAFIEGMRVGIKIQDNGCGIPPEALDKIFDPFYTSKPGGYGLGLAICYQLIKDNKGQISIESQLGEGTIATVYLPAAKEEGDR
ncbi:MAG: ATP-binding protein, partial [Eubacteriales bacterium]